ncbi:MAG: polysaccharide deacetylase family protein [Candidatus Omnitrophica bacterium]|nr:polysaccharide deacetylase family protein [Candidatus Omnitrophota bacterium]
MMMSSMCYSLGRGVFARGREDTGFRVLLYHSINSADAQDYLGIRVKPESFYRQMEYLYRENYRVLSLGNLIKYMGDSRPIPARSLAITFDDGYKDILKNAVPVLKKFGFTATIFIAPTYIEGDKGNPENYWEKWEYLSWEELKHLADSNIDIGSHSLSHRPLRNMAKEAMHKEARESKNRLEQALGVSVDLFSYPHGVFNQELKDILRKDGYIAACSSLPGKNDSQCDVFELKRTEINTQDSLFEFKKKLAGSYDWISFFRKSKR